MKKAFTILALTIIFATLVSACGSRSARNAEVATAIAQTVEAMNAQAPLVTYVVVTPDSTSTPLPTNTAIPLIPTATSAPTSAPRSCNAISFISENPLDGVTYAPGETFTKSWRFKNVGTCTWNPHYKVVYASGNSISGAGTKQLNTYVAPGETIDIVYTFKAPSTAGTYKTVFYLKDDEGNTFAQFWVQFKVKSTSATSVPTPGFAVTSVTFYSSDAVKTGTCPQTFDYNAVITANKAGTVTYHWEFSDGSAGSTQSVTFNAAGSKTVSGTWNLNASGAYWVKLYIDNPNHQLFGQLNLSLTCTPAFAVTGVTFPAPTTPYTASTCSPLALDYQIDVAANGAGTVTYSITFSDSTSTNGSLPFSSAGTQSITGTWDVGAVTTGTYWFNIYIDNPNHQLFGPHSIVVTCP